MARLKRFTGRDKRYKKQLKKNKSSVICSCFFCAILRVTSEDNAILFKTEKISRSESDKNAFR